LYKPELPGTPGKARVDPIDYYGRERAVRFAYEALIGTASSLAAGRRNMRTSSGRRGRAAGSMLLLVIALAIASALALVLSRRRGNLPAPPTGQPAQRAERDAEPRAAQLPATTAEHPATLPPATQEQVDPEPAVLQPPARPGTLTYAFDASVEHGPAEIRQSIRMSMEEAVLVYNSTVHFAKHITVRYDPAVPTAHANFNGNLTFGGQIGTRTALHEIAHTLGIGTHPKWTSMIREGRWTGEHAMRQLRAFDGADAELCADRQHFWPYGLNYEKEASEENYRRHVHMVAAFCKDLEAAGRPGDDRGAPPEHAADDRVAEPTPAE
jgi:hypothetical protein